jgi:hypothetical protein
VRRDVEDTETADREEDERRQRKGDGEREQASR